VHRPSRQSCKPASRATVGACERENKISDTAGAQAVTHLTFGLVQACRAALSRSGFTRQKSC
jgi:hypothetical protein